MGLMSAAIAAGEIGGGSNVSDDLDGDTVKAVLFALMAVCAIAVVLVLRTVRKQSVRFVLVGILVAAGVGLFIERRELDDCADQCSCRLFGKDVDVSGSGAFCADRDER
jgi:hypothetical protein